MLNVISFDDAAKKQEEAILKEFRAIAMKHSYHMLKSDPFLSREEKEARSTFNLEYCKLADQCGCEDDQDLMRKIQKETARAHHDVCEEICDRVTDSMELGRWAFYAGEEGEEYLGSYHSNLVNWMPRERREEHYKAFQQGYDSAKKAHELFADLK